jgi:hypothetical protein
MHDKGWTTYSSVSGLHSLYPWRNAERCVIVIGDHISTAQYMLQSRRNILLVPEVLFCTTDQMGARVHG